MDFTPSDVLKFLEKMAVRTRRDYFPLKLSVRFKTFNCPAKLTCYGINKYRVKTILKNGYQVGTIPYRFDKYKNRNGEVYGAPLPKIVLDAPSYSQAIFSDPTFPKLDGHTFKNDDWAFTVPYCFRDELGLRYVPSTIKKTKTTTYKWMQSAFLAFSVGSMFYSKDKRLILQVEEGLRCGFDDVIFDYGFVRFSVYETSEHDQRCTLVKRYTTNQFEFLQLLIFGSVRLKAMSEIGLSAKNSPVLEGSS